MLTVSSVTIGVPAVYTQTFDNNGCVGANFGIDAGLYSGIIEYGDGTPASNTTDWFAGPSGRGTIDESQSAAIASLLMGGGNPTYELRMNSGIRSVVDNQLLIDAVWTRDEFGGTGYYDQTSFKTASKNGEDPAVWDPGPMNVLGKNDLIDVSGHMLRNGITLTDDLWFYGMINRAEPSGDAYMDFEFFIEKVTYDPASGFTSGGPDLGHTAFSFDASGNITSVGDFIFNVSLVNGGVNPTVELRIWVSYSDYLNLTPSTGFTWGPAFDGAFNGAPYGYASIIPLSDNACGIINMENENPATPPWGSLGTKENIYISNYLDYSVVEVGINMTAFGIDHASLLGVDLCDFPIHTFIAKTRASSAFTAQLKDFAGPFTWGYPIVKSVNVYNELLSCSNPEVTLSTDPQRNDLSYVWTTTNGNITGDPYAASITVDQPGTYYLNYTLPEGCEGLETYVIVEYDPAQPPFNEPTGTTTVACHGNDGSIDLTVTGATPPYSFEWYEAGEPAVISTLEDPSGLIPGDYYVIITDAAACDITSANFTVGTRVPTTITESITNVDCNGNSTGAIDLTVSGQDPFTYSWSIGSTGEDITGLSADDYTITTTDEDGCTQQKIITVTEPAELSLSVSSTNDTNPDPGINDGTIDLTVSGGTSPYTYDWDYNGAEDPDIDPEDLSGLASGTYTVIVTDANGCAAVIEASIYEPEICDDGIDNDGDGLTDCFDPDCTPPTPGAITPSDTPVCVGDTGITYTIDPVAGVSVFNWIVPAGAVISSGQGTISITVDWVSNTGGQICVSSDNAGCSSSAPSCLTIDLNDVPPIPEEIEIIK